VGDSKIPSKRRVRGGGRVSPRCGLVGLPNAGKSTLFNALAHANVPAEPYPFCTVDPHEGSIILDDPRLEPLAELLHPEKIIRPHVDVVDIAGLIQGSHRGEGLGNQFLNHIREVDLILHVVRCFHRQDVSHPEGRIDPAGDYEIIRTELALKDLEILQRRIEKEERMHKIGQVSAGMDIDQLRSLAGLLERGPLDPGSSPDMKLPPDLILLTGKPEIVVFNLGEEAVQDADLSAAADGPKLHGVSIRISLESDLAAMDPEEAREIREGLGFGPGRIPVLLDQIKSDLRLITYFTKAHDVLQAWLIPEGSTIYDAAGRIHGDIQQGLIRAEVFRADDYLSHGNEASLRAEGLIRIEGRDAPVREGDVVHFKFRG